MTIRTTQRSHTYGARLASPNLVALANLTEERYLFRSINQMKANIDAIGPKYYSTSLRDVTAKFRHQALPAYLIPNGRVAVYLVTKPIQPS